MKTLIIGHGFSGSHFKNFLNQAECADLPECSFNDTIPFDYRDKSQWSLFENYSTIIFTAKIDDVGTARLLAPLLKNKKVIILSTAKAFQTLEANEKINENSKLVESQRNKAESCFQENALILHLGLIWGAERQPERWLKEGRIKNGAKYVNLIHIIDLCHIVQKIIDSSEKPQRLLISDGHPQKWQKIADSYNVTLPELKVGTESKLFDTSKLERILRKHEFTLP